MRPILRIAFLFGVAVLSAPVGAGECVDGDVRCDDACGEEACDGACRDWSYDDEDLCRVIPPPKRPGPHRCVVRPEVKDVKKTVYDVKWVPYCLPKPSCPGCCRDDCRRPCPECEKCVRWKKVVVKREVVVGRKCCYTCEAEECFPGRSPAAAGHAFPPVPAAPPAPPAR